ncbi:MAG: argininosuccinate lyase [Clostridiaceae bacterium]|nr:argininosuccinate lyase [Clostridiaceae bacterium]
MSNKLWSGRFTAATDALLDDFNSSIPFDQRLWPDDIAGSRAHARMLEHVGLLTTEELAAIEQGLDSIEADLTDGTLAVDPTAEDIHMFIEAELTRRIGEPGRKLHTGRSRNDQVAVDIRLYLRRMTSEVRTAIRSFIETLVEIAAANLRTIMPGFTHLQIAQPITLAHHFSAYAHMLERDWQRLGDAVDRMNYSPLGAGALATCTLPLDPARTAAELGFDGVCGNSLDAVSDRDFCVEICAALALLMTHLSRLSEELILWASTPFGFITPDDAWSTGSSMMPQKKNPDIPELVRGKSARVISNLNTLLVMLKGLPLAYNKDMQEDKEAIFEALDTVLLTLPTLQGFVVTMKINSERMRSVAESGLSNATDLAEYLVRRGLPFRQAHEQVGKLVYYALEQGKKLEELSLDEFRAQSSLVDDSVYAALKIENCVAARDLPGGPAPTAVETALRSLCERLDLSAKNL